MPIPNFDLRGNLPPGIHQATLEEIRRRFGTHSLARRKRQQALETILEELRPVSLGIYIDGSFVTDKLAPNDVDLIAVLPSRFDFEGPDGLTLARVIAHARRMDLDLYAYEKDDAELRWWIPFFSHDRDTNRKGIVFLEVTNDKD